MGAWFLYAVFSFVFLCPLLSAEPMGVRPVEPIWEGTQLVGFTSNEASAEFIVPDSWRLKNSGLLLRYTDKTEVDLILLLEPYYSLDFKGQKESQSDGIDKVYLPMPFRLVSAELFVPDILGDIKAVYLPAEGNLSSSCYFRIQLTQEQIDTLFRLSLQGQAFVGAAHLTINLPEFTSDTQVPIQVSIDPKILNPGYSADHPWVRDLRTDDGSGEGIAGNGLCEGDELCAFRDIKTSRLWIPVFGSWKSANEWEDYCQSLGERGYPNMNLPRLEDILEARGRGLWDKMRLVMFPGARWWETRTSHLDGTKGNSFTIGLNNGEVTSSNHVDHKTDRSVCVSTLMQPQPIE